MNDLTTPEPNEVVPAWAISLLREQAATTQALAGILAQIDNIGGEIKPLVSALSKSPMLKMMGVKL